MSDEIDESISQLNNLSDKIMQYNVRNDSRADIFAAVGFIKRAIDLLKRGYSHD